MCLCDIFQHRRHVWLLDLVDLLSLYMFHVVEKAPTVPWLLMEFVFSAVWSVLYFLVALIILTRGGIYAAAGFFGFAATVIYAADAFFSYQSYQAGEVAQSERTQPVQNA
ncbi:hypothetical protein HDE_11935 [Halotydeus destructor]|nr:hypothetical protein HDE_11935 [Halotydeus destructor]